MFKPELDKKTMYELEKEWKKREITDRNTLDRIIEALEEMGVDVENNIYVRNPTVADLRIDAKCWKYHENGTDMIDIIIVYERK